MHESPYITGFSRHIWEKKYRYRERERSVTDTWRRIAGALADVEARDAAQWERRFYEALKGFRFLPGGRIQAGAGTSRRVTLFNCFVMGTIEDSMEGIFDSLKEGALTMQQGGGVGYDFSTLRPAGSPARETGSIASGPVSFMRIWDAMCATMLSTGARRGAMMATLRCDHPDIGAFVTAKRAPGELRHFNLSVQVTDAFMEALREDDNWELVFPVSDLDPGETSLTSLRQWPGQSEAVPCRVMRRIRARALWEQIMKATYEYAEPGVLFIDRINRLNNLRYCEAISATNPCGEIPLPPYGACNLGSVNLTCFVEDPFTKHARLDLTGIQELAAIATRMLDNVIDLSLFPLEQQATQARSSRRIGLGITGLADALIMLGLHYGQPQARAVAAQVMQTICHSAYRASIALAREKGPFPLFEAARFLDGAFVSSLPIDIRDGCARYGLRNSHLTAIAPAGTISLLAGNVSSGIEPVFDLRYGRRVLEEDRTSTFALTDYAYRVWLQTKGSQGPLPDYFVEAQRLPPTAHLDMQAALQPHVDQAISKTITVPADYPFDAFRALYEQAYEKGLKGCTTFRSNPVTGTVLSPVEAVAGMDAPHCCTLEREAD